METTPPPPAKTEAEKQQGVLSKVLGAGVGTSIIVAASYFEISPNHQVIIMSSAPTISVVIAWCGPIIARVILAEVSLAKLRFHLGRMRKIAATYQEGSGKQEAIDCIVAMEKAVNAEILGNYIFDSPIIPG